MFWLLSCRVRFGSDMFNRLLWVLVCITTLNCASAQQQVITEGQVCRGTNNGLTVSGTPLDRYDFLKRMFTNCTYVLENIEIVGLENLHGVNLDFFKDIREVNGYVLIRGSLPLSSTELPLPNLKIVRGEKLMSLSDNQPARFSLVVTLVPEIRSLGLRSLREISRGDVNVNFNEKLCFGDTIAWDDIFKTSVQKAEINISGPCPDACSQTCSSEVGSKKSCWGPKSDDCQSVNKKTCAPQCEYRCFGQGPHECCHPECLAGCNGPKETDCWGCRNFYNNGSCVQSCPRSQFYNSTTYKYEQNPNATVSFGKLCLPKCPEGYLEFEEGCILHSCPPGYKDENKKCVTCGGLCPRVCDWQQYNADEWISAEVLRNPNNTNCTTIAGNVPLIASSFQNTPKSDSHSGRTAVTIEDLRIFESVEKITGTLQFQSEGYLPALKSLSFFRNLKSIGGVGSESGYAMEILSNSIEYLEMLSLSEISTGSVWIEAPKLCYTSRAYIQSLVRGKDIAWTSNGQCVAKGQVCHSECDDSCMGPTDMMCTKCKNFKVEGRCLADCNTTGLYRNGTMCGRCHDQCQDSCTGPLESDCTACKNVKDGPMCRAQCPDIKFLDNSTRTCKNCHPNCRKGCTGGTGNVQIGGCQSCETVMYHPSNESVQCLTPKSGCPEGFFKTSKVPSYLSSKFARFSEGQLTEICLPCNDQCGSCSYIASNCESCKYFEQMPRRNDGTLTCVSTCGPDFFTNQTASTCEKCHELCIGCTGPTEYRCQSCAAVSAKLSDDDKTFQCVRECPTDQPYRVLQGTEQVCSRSPRSDAIKLTKPQMGGIIAGVVVFVVVLIAASIGTAFFCRQRSRTKERILRITESMNTAVTETLDQTDAAPDLSRLRLIKESELKRTIIIGSGAFGTVYKGIWIPEGENVKIPVAIKVLIEGTSPSMNVELLEEARIMASVDNPCCIKILAVCLTAQMMLVTQLMTEGCLLNYVRKYTKNIGSKVMLDWCTQIAKGMAYLESLRIVHRDLAARNVLVQNERRVKITDFGLAKLVDIKEEYYKAESGKVPIKWMALESIQHRIFDHRTDVWSYGVTVWEILTYGDKPYDNIRARDVPLILERGERLQQPSISTIDVYMIMIKCWMLDASARPTFEELASNFARMSRDPGRYLVIAGDELMRVPTAKRDNHDLPHLEDEFPEKKLIDADDYLQPTGFTGQEHRYENEIPNTRLPDTSTLSSYMGQKQGQSGTGPIGECRSPLRYTSTPTLKFPEGADGANQATNDYLEPITHANVMTTPLIDEDGYLEPRGKTTATYLDLMREAPSNAAVGLSGVPVNRKEYGDPSKGDEADVPLLSADNPMYLSSSQVEQPYHTDSPSVGYMSNNNGSLKVNRNSYHRPDYVNQP